MNGKAIMGAKKVLALLLSLCMLIGMLPMGAFAETGEIVLEEDVAVLSLAEENEQLDEEIAVRTPVVVANDEQLILWLENAVDVDITLQNDITLTQNVTIPNGHIKTISGAHTITLGSTINTIINIGSGDDPATLAKLKLEDGVIISALGHFGSPSIIAVNGDLEMVAGSTVKASVEAGANSKSTTIAGTIISPEVGKNATLTIPTGAEVVVSGDVDRISYKAYTSMGKVTFNGGTTKNFDLSGGQRDKTTGEVVVNGGTHSQLAMKVNKITLAGGSVATLSLYEVGNMASITNGEVTANFRIAEPDGDKVSIKLGDNGVNISTTVHMYTLDNQPTYATLAADSTAPTSTLRVNAKNHELGDIIFNNPNGSINATTIKAIADKITITGLTGDDYIAEVKDGDIVLGEKDKVIFVSENGNDTNDGLTTATAVKTIGGAYSKIDVDKVGEIRLLSDLEVSTPINLNARKTVTIQSYKADGTTVETASPHVIKRAVGFKDNVLAVSNGDATLKNVIFDGQGGVGDLSGNESNSKALVRMTGGSLTLDTGAVLQNNSAINESGGIHQTSGKLVMKDGSFIQDNEQTGMFIITGGTPGATSAGGIGIDGPTTEFYMLGGTIQRNDSMWGGGITTVATEGSTSRADKFVISGGEIKENTAGHGSGIGGGTGGILVDAKSRLTMTGGSIVNNTGVYGGISLWATSNWLYLDEGSSIKITGNKTLGGEPCDLRLSNSSQRVQLLGSLAAGSNIGVELQTMPTQSAPVQVVAVGAGYTPNDSDKSKFKSNNTTKAGILLDASNRVVLSFEARDLLENVYVDGVNGSDTAGNGTVEKPFATLLKGYSEVKNEGKVHIVGNLDMVGNIEFKTDKVVTITSADPSNVSTIQYNSGTFYVTDGHIKLKDIILDGGGKNRNRGGAFVYIGYNAAKTPQLTLESGGVIQNACDLAQAVLGWGVIVVKTGTFTMNDGSLVQNLTAASGSIRLGSEGNGNNHVVINGGTIRNCDSMSIPEGNALYVAGGATVTMKGGKITECGQNSNASTGTIYLHPTSGHFTMTGGEISGNRAKYGGGIYSYAGTITLSGNPIIKGNEGVALQGESNIYLMNGQTVTMGGRFTGAAKAGDVGIYTQTTPTLESGDIKIATLADSTDMKYFISDKDTTAGVLFKAEDSCLYLSYGARYNPLTPGIDSSTGEGFIVAEEIESGKTMVLVDQQGNVVAIVDGEKTDYLFENLNPGEKYTGYVIDTANKSKVPAVGGTWVSETHDKFSETDHDAVIPAVDMNLSAQVNVDNTITITIEPAADGTYYAVAAADGTVVGGGWKQGDSGKLEFPGLDPDTEYTIVASQTSGGASIDKEDYPGGVDATTPASTYKDVEVDDVDRSLDGKTVTINPTELSQEYAVRDPETGKIVGGWTAGTGSDVSFGGLDPKKEYEVITRDKDKNPESIPGAGVTVLPGVSGTGKKENIKGETDSSGESSIIINPTDNKCWYAVVDESGNIIDVDNSNDGWILGTGGEIVFGGLDKDTDYKVVTYPKGDGSVPTVREPISGGTGVVTAPVPVTGAERKEDSVADDGTDMLKFDVENEYEYAVVEKGKTPSASDWFDNSTHSGTGTTGGGELSYEIAADGETVEVTALDDETEYEIFVRVKDKDDGKTIVLDSSTRVPPRFIAKGKVDNLTGDGYITIDSAKDEKKYVLTDSEGIVLEIIDSWTDESFKFEDLMPGGSYKVFEVDENKSVSVGDATAVWVQDQPDNPQDYSLFREIEIPVFDTNISAEVVGSPEKISITIDPSCEDVKYAVVDSSGNVVQTTGGADGWIDGNGGKITFEGLDPDEEYEIVTVPIDNTAPPSGGLGGTGQGITTPSAGFENVGVGAVERTQSGEEISVYPSKSSEDYAIIDPDTGEIVAGWTQGNDGNLIFENLDPKKDYVVINRENGNDPESLPSKGLTVLPGTTATGVTEDVLADKESIKIDPSDENIWYAVVDRDGNIVKVDGSNNGWISGNGDEIVFGGLNPDTPYIVVTVPKDGSGIPTVEEPIAGGKGMLTAPEPVDVVREPDSSTSGSDKKDVLHFQTDDEHTYIVIPRGATSGYRVVTGGNNKPSTNAGNGLTFETDGTGMATVTGLDPSLDYDVIAISKSHGSNYVHSGTVTPAPKFDGEIKLEGRVIADGEMAGDPQAAGVAGATVSVVVNTVNGPKKITVETDKDGYYVIEASSVMLGDYNIYVDGKDEGCEGAANVSLTMTKPQKVDDIALDKGKTSIVGGVLTENGNPVVGERVVVRDKQTGAVISSSTYDVMLSSDAGGYVIAGLAEGTYIIQSSGSGTSGMTEIKVDATGNVTPNTVGGYTNTNIGRNKGYILSGKVTGLAAGETAKVTISVPVYDNDGNLIGSKTLHAVAEGEGGYYQFAGVDSGTYTVTVTDENGESASQLTTVNNANRGNVNFDLGNAIDDDAPNALMGTVVDHTGKPITSASVSIYDSEGNKLPVNASTGKGGGYTFLLSDDKNDIPDGIYYISADKNDYNGLVAVEIKDGVVVSGKTNIVVDTASRGKLLTGKVEDSLGTLASGAIVVVKDSDGNVVATTTTNINGQYFVPNVPAGATVSVTTENGETATKTVVASGNILKGDVTTSKPSDSVLVIIGPDGTPLELSDELSNKSYAQVTVKETASGNDDDVTSNAYDSTNKCVDVTSLPDGTYIVEIEQNGMLYTKEIVVSDKKIVGENTIIIPTYEIKGDVAYEVGTRPSSAVVIITGGSPVYTWAEIPVDPITGTFDAGALPAGEYTFALKVTDDDKSANNSVYEATITVSDKGVITYSAFTSSNENGSSAEATVARGKTFIKIKPSTEIKAVSSALTAQTALGTAAELQNALDSYIKLTDEQRLQIDSRIIAAANGKLDKLLAEMHLSVDVLTEVIGVNNVSQVKEELESQKTMFVDKKDITTAEGVDTSVDIELALTAEPVTDDPNPNDMNKVEALATRVNADIGDIYDVSITKKVTTTVDGSGLQSKSVSVHKVSETPQSITLTLTIPPMVMNEYQYFAVVRVHNGVAQILPSTIEREKITFSTNKFSTYALLYSNEPIFGGSENLSDDGGGGIDTSDSIKDATTDGGKVIIDNKNPNEGETVTITVVPDDGYVLDSIVVTDKDGNTVAIISKGNNSYEFTYGGGGYTVKAIFKKTGVSDWFDLSDHKVYLYGDNKGTVRPNGELTRGEAAAMFFRLLKDDVKQGAVKSVKFSDIPEDRWFTDAVLTLASLDIINGYKDGTFKPYKTISRAEFVAIATRFAKVSSTGKGFEDVQESYWAYENIMTASGYGWIEGRTSTKFAPKENITRGEATAVINRMLDRNADKEYVKNNADKIKDYSDLNTKHWAYYYIAEASNEHDFYKTDGKEVWK